MLHIRQAHGVDHDPLNHQLFQHKDGYHGVSAGNPECGFEIAGFMPISDAHLMAAAPDLLEALQAIYLGPHVIEISVGGKLPQSAEEAYWLTVDWIKTKASIAIAKATRGA